MSYYVSKKVHIPFEKAVEKIKEELKKEGFGILTEIDVKSTLKKKLNVEFRNYVILGACNPPFAYKPELCIGRVYTDFHKYYLKKKSV